MRATILIGLILALLAGCWIASGQTFIGRPLMPLSGGVPFITLPNAAYSVARKLSTSYSGSALRIRRSGDDAEQDIGFSGGETDIVSIQSFIGTNNAFVTTVYDQSGNGWHCTNAASTQQPMIAEAGSVFVDGNGKPWLRLSDANDFLTTVENVTTNQVATSLSVFSANTHTAGSVIVSAESSTTASVSVITSSGNRIYWRNASNLIGPLYSTNTHYLVTGLCGAGTNDFVQLNNTAPVMGDVGSKTVSRYRFGNPSVALPSFISEYFMFAEEISGTELANIQENIRTFYNLY